MNKKITIAAALAGVAVFALALCTPRASAQVGPISITFGTNRVPSVLTNSTAGTAFFVGNQRTVSILSTIHSTNTVLADATGTGTFTQRFNGSMDNSTYFQNGTNWDIVFTMTATNSATGFATFDTSQVQYLRPAASLNSSTNMNVFQDSATYWYK